MDIHIPQGDYYLHGDDTFIEEDDSSHFALLTYIQNKYTNDIQILSQYGRPYLKCRLNDVYIEFETDYTGYWKVAEMRPKIEVKDRYSDKELIKFIDFLYKL